MQQFQHIVEAGRVRSTLLGNGEQTLQVAGDEVALEQGLAGMHPVAVALHGVDLAVVGHVAIGVTQRPAGKRVGGKS